MPIGDTITGAGLGLLLGGYNDRRQAAQQKRLQQIEIEGQKEMGKYNQGLALEMWEKTNYAAQRAQMEKAGLNVGLMYEGGGPGGTTQTPTGNVSGATAAGHTGEVGMGMQMALATAMQQAQIELTKAQTEKTKIEAVKTAGVDTEESKGRIDNLAQDLKNKQITEKQAWQTLQNLQRDELLKQLDAQVKEKELTQMDLQREVTQADIVFKELQNEWMKAGVTTSDDPRLRMLIRVMNEQGIHTFKELFNAIKSAIGF